MQLLRSRSEIVTPLPLQPPVCRDPDDDAVLATALSGGAECIVTGDKDLLVLQRHGNVVILKPAEFVAWETAREA